MKKIIIMLLFLFGLSACSMNTDASSTTTSLTTQQTTITSTETQTTTVTTAFTEKDLLNEYLLVMNENEDFQNTWFESEKEYYEQFFNTRFSFKIDYEDVIDYDVQNLIFHEACIRIDRISEAIILLNNQEELMRQEIYEIDRYKIQYDFVDNVLELLIEDDENEVYGFYRVSIDEEDMLFFDSLEVYYDSIFEGQMISYIVYDQGNTYHERNMLVKPGATHYFQYDYNFEENLATTFLTTAIPSLNQYDIGRSERHFGDEYYVVYSKGLVYENKYFTLFNENHSSINVSRMELNVGETPELFYTLQWNLMDIEGWDFIQNNKVYMDDLSFPITPFFYEQLPYFGPEFTITEEYDSMFTDSDLATPFDHFSYDVYTLQDCAIPQNLLDDLSEQFDVTETGYVEFGVQKNFEDGFIDRFLEFIDIEYLESIYTYLDHSVS